MTHAPSQTSVFTTTEFDRWWVRQGEEMAATFGLEPSIARTIAWAAWRGGREQLTEVTAHQRLQLSRR